MSRLTLGFIVMSVMGLIALGWTTDHYRSKYLQAERLASERQSTIEEMTRHQQISAALDAKYTQELADAKSQIDALHADVAAGRRRLHLNAQCVSTASTQTGTASMDDATFDDCLSMGKVSELYDEEKTQVLKQNIKAAQLPDDIEKFLMSAAERHTVFNFSRIADYYAHAPAEIQILFEQSALVIIDYHQAIEQGLVHMTKSIVDAVFECEEGDDA
ncbi:lysis protein [Yersinia similis]|uniref:lysis protein n=1 Tax=Yersinia similis TaxID=367190 RepID=UPI0021BD8864|nr:lysis protein [Yersinia similis]